MRDEISSPLRVIADPSASRAARALAEHELALQQRRVARSIIAAGFFAASDAAIMFARKLLSRRARATAP